MNIDEDPVGMMVKKSIRIRQIILLRYHETIYLIARYSTLHCQLLSTIDALFVSRSVKHSQEERKKDIYFTFALKEI